MRFYSILKVSNYLIQIYSQDNIVTDLKYAIYSVDMAGQILQRGSVNIYNDGSTKSILNFLDCKPYGISLINCVISEVGSRLKIVQFKIDYSDDKTTLAFSQFTIILKYLDFEPENVILLNDYLVMQAKSKQAAMTPPPNDRSGFTTYKNSLYDKRSLLVYKITNTSKSIFLSYAYTQDFYCQDCLTQSEMFSISSGQVNTFLLRTKS